MDLGLEGKVAVVTGGSRGIGKAIARTLAHEGCDVALIARSVAAANAAAEEIASSSGRRARAYAADTGSDDSVRTAVNDIAREFGRIDILVNCAAQAGGQSAPPKLDEITSELFWDDVNIKVLGYLRMARECAPHLAKADWARIVNISGLAARQTGSTIGSIRNVGVAALTKNLADELGPRGIGVVCVHPGVTRTEKTADVLAQQAAAQGVSVTEIEDRLKSRTSIKRIVGAEDIAEIVAFLASAKSFAINGESIGAGGGALGAIHY